MCGVAVPKVMRRLRAGLIDTRYRISHRNQALCQNQETVQVFESGSIVWRTAHQKIEQAKWRSYPQSVAALSSLSMPVQVEWPWVAKHQVNVHVSNEAFLLNPAVCNEENLARDRLTHA